MSCAGIGIAAGFDPDYYSKIYNRIYETIIAGYLDYYLLEFYDRQDENTKDEQSRHFVLHHLSNLIMRDLCLNLWKICYDEDQESCTLSNLNTYLRKNNINSLYNKSAYIKHMAKDIEEARNKYVAHLDRDSTENKIAISSMKQLLDDAKDALNMLCMDKFGVDKITDFSMSMLDFHTTMDAISLLHQVPLVERKEEKDQE